MFKLKMVFVLSTELTRSFMLIKSALSLLLSKLLLQGRMQAKCNCTCLVYLMTCSCSQLYRGLPATVATVSFKPDNPKVLQNTVRMSGFNQACLSVCLTPIWHLAVCHIFDCRVDIKICYSFLSQGPGCLSLRQFQLN
jgi:hypothetical protein